MVWKETMSAVAPMDWVGKSSGILHAALISSVLYRYYQYNPSRKPFAQISHNDMNLTNFKEVYKPNFYQAEDDYCDSIFLNQPYLRDTGKCNGPRPMSM